MSLQPARVQPAPTPRSTPPRRLRPVAAPSPKRRPKLAYAALAVGGALAIGIAQMGVSFATTQDAFVLAQLSSQQHDLGLEKQALHETIVGLSSPQSLAAKADSLGLVVAGSASYLRLSDGTVLGAGDGADWASTVNPNGATSVGNALLAPPPKKTPEQTSTPADDLGATDAQPALPPTVTDGLPSPTTR
ncbi:hypothetical protein [Microbacterium sp. H1-D42]|uniref:hypothetical protein n=1 Tax=Microbacterium sp. H1-D42 TaxID=2925844 RepID=UPI001F537853|nr:hypothetical protein [Microbacterium sp. H1-D42]UNK72111.1 hypothetical protein MNR00_06630 [Microbacterium sp. H1-D42]